MSSHSAPTPKQTGFRDQVAIGMFGIRPFPITTFEELDMILNLAETKIHDSYEQNEDPKPRLAAELRKNITTAQGVSAQRIGIPGQQLDSFILREHCLVEEWNFNRFGRIQAWLADEHLQENVPDVGSTFPLMQASYDLGVAFYEPPPLQSYQGEMQAHPSGQRPPSAETLLDTTPAASQPIFFRRFVEEQMHPFRSIPSSMNVAQTVPQNSVTPKSRFGRSVPMSNAPTIDVNISTKKASGTGPAPGDGEATTAMTKTKRTFHTIGLNESPSPALPFPNGNFTIVEICCFMPQYLRCIDVINRIASNRIEQNQLVKMIKAHRQVEHIAQLESTITRMEQRAMRYLGGDFAKWTFKKHKAAPDFPHDSISVAGFRTTEQVQGPSSKYPNASIPLKSLAEKVKLFPTGYDCLDLTRAVRYALEHPDEPLQFPDDYALVLQKIGGPAVVLYEHLDLAASARWKGQLARDRAAGKDEAWQQAIAQHALAYGALEAANMDAGTHNDAAAHTAVPRTESGANKAVREDGTDQRPTKKHAGT